MADLEADVEPPEEEEWQSANGDAGEQSRDNSADEAVTGAGHATQSDSPEEESTRSLPVRIATTTKRDTTDQVNVGSGTPGSTAAFALAAGLIADGVLTPRNDAGPFILDGNAGRNE